MERLHGQTVKALANHFGGPGSIPNAGAVVRGNNAVKFLVPCLMLP